MLTLTDKLVARSKTATFTTTTLALYQAEVKKDAEIGVKWLDTYEKRVLGELKHGVDLMLKEAPDWAEDETKRRVKQTEQAIKDFCRTADPKKAVFSWPMHALLDYLDDPERYADGPPRGENPMSPLLRTLRKEEELGQKFGHRFLDKYSLKGRAEMRLVVSEQERETLDAAFKAFLLGLFDEPFKKVVDTFARDLSKRNRTASGNGDTSRRTLDSFLWKYRVQVPGAAFQDTLTPTTGVTTAYPEPSLSPLAVRLATRVMEKEGFTFPTPKALMNYLREHPKADKSKHEVAEKGEKADPPKSDKADKGHGKDEHEEHEEKPKKSEPDFSPLSRKLAEKVKGWGAKAVKTLADAPKEVQKFVEDDAHRRKTLMEAHKKVDHLFNLPEELIKTAKEEIHEFKDAGSALGKLLKGGKLSKHDKHALKTVGTHLAVTAAATALTATSFGAGAALFGKAMAKHVALKAVSGVLAKGHMLEELGHIGHGIQHVMDKLAADKPDGGKGKDDPMSQFARMVLGAVAKEMDELDVKSIGEALDAFSGDGSDVKPLKGKKKAMVERLVDRARKV